MSDMDIIDISPQNSMTSGSMIRELVTAEIDQQISTAHAYPRSITKVNRNIVSLVTLDKDFAQECTFALPRGGKPITGPSIRMAEVVFSQWGNCRGGARVVHVDRKEMFVEAEGVFHDLETNAATTKRVRRRISDKNGKLLSDDMIIVTGNAACSIAFRNAILAGVPKMVWGPAYDTALRMIKGDVTTLPEYRQTAMKSLAAFGIKPEQAFAVLGVAGMADIGLDEILILSGYVTAIKNEEITVEALLANAAPSNAAPARVAGSISQRATATGPAQTFNQDKPQPKANPAAEATLEAEARRVAADREAAARKKQEADEKAAHAKAMADAEARVKKDAEAKQEAEAAAKTAEADAEAAKAAAEAQTQADLEAADRAQVSEDDGQAEEGEQGEGDPDPQEDTHSPAALEAFYDAIMNDLLDDMPVDVAKKTHASKIAAIQAADPAMYARLLDEMSAA